MCEAGSSPTRTVARPTWPSSATEAATSSRTFAPSALPSMIVAVTSRRLVGQNARAVRLPRKNDADSVQRAPAGARAARGRPRAVREGRRVGDRPRLDPGLGRAARGLARRVRALGGRRGRRDRPGRRGGRRPARAHRGRADRLRAARREGDRGVRRLPNVRDRRQDHPSILLCLQTRGRRARARPLDRGRGAGDARVPARGRQPGALPPRRPARGEDARRRPDVPRPLALHDRRRRSART